MEHFVSNCRYSSFLEDNIRREETVATYESKFETTSMLGTLTNYLQLPNLPSKRAFRECAKNITQYGQLTSTNNANVHQLTTHSYNDYDEYADSHTPYSDETELTYAFNASINAVKTRPTQTIDKPCLVCQIITGQPPADGHRFESCPVLNNSAALCDQYKDICKIIMRHRRLMQTTPTNVNKTTTVTFQDNSSHQSSQTSDFLSGHP